MTISTIPRTYKKRTPKPKPIAIEVKKIIREELLGWNNKFTITYFEENVKTANEEILKVFVTVFDDGNKLYYKIEPKIELRI
jgi:hypothetical protein